MRATTAPSLVPNLIASATSAEEPEVVCERFLRLLVDGVGLSQAAIWLGEVDAPTGGAGMLTLVRAVPTVRGLQPRLSAHHPVLGRLGSTPVARPDAIGGIVSFGGALGVEVARLGESGLLLMRAGETKPSEVPGLEQAIEILGRILGMSQELGRLRWQNRELAAERDRLEAGSLRLNTLLQSLRGGVLAEDEQRTITLVNQAFCDLFLVPSPPSSLVGLDCSQSAEQSKGLFRDPEGFVQRVEALLERREPVLDDRLEMVDGRVLERDYLPVFRDGLYRGHVWLYRDVTERYRAQDEVARLKAFYEQVLDSMPIQLAILDPEGRYLHVTPSAIADAETRAWIVGRNDLDYCARRGLGAEVAVQRRARLEQVVRERRLLQFEESFTDRMGQLRHFIRFLHPVMDAAGRPTQVLGFGLDVTERKRAEAALRSSEARKRAVLESALDCVITMNEDGRILEFNPAAESTFGYPEELAVGRTLADLVLPPDERAAYLERLEQLRREPERPRPGLRLELLALRWDGTTFPADLGLSTVTLDNGSRLFTATLRDISDRLATEAQLREATRQAEESARAKEQFLANMSHEIRTPLNAVIGMTHLLATTELDREQREFVEAVRFSADALLRLINDVLDFSKIDAGHLVIEQHAFELPSLLRGLVDSLRGNAVAKAVALRCELTPELPVRVLGDSMRLSQILTNLLGNALKFTERGEVRLSASLVTTTPEESWVRFSVADTGPGIAADQHDSIFEAFTQERRDTARRFGGTGLGLAIVRQLVERLGGRIRLDSAPGQGATFEVLLPFLPARPAAPAVSPEAPVDLGGVRILLVEDNKLNQMVAQRLLALSGALVEVVGDGFEALARLGREAFDLVLLDIQMPGLDGFETCRRIRQELGLGRERLPILALTASALVEQRNRAIEAGMDDFLLKPYDPAELRARVARLVGVLTSDPPPRVSAQERPAGLIDYALLEERTLGQPAFTLEMIELFAQQAEKYVEELRRAAAADDRKALRALAHRCKSSSALVGAEPLSACFAELEERAEQAGAPLEALVTSALELTAGSVRELLAARSRYREEAPECAV